MALYNDCKHGHRVKGNVIDLALLRSVPHPGAALVGKGDRADGAEEKIYTDLDHHVFRYALRPHGPEADAARLTAEARAFNAPLRVTEGRAADAGLPAAEFGPRVDSSAIEIAAVKPAEDGEGWVWRLVNLTEAAVEARVASPAGVWCESSLVETGDAALARDVDGGFVLSFGPFEIKTLRQR